MSIVTLRRFALVFYLFFSFGHMTAAQTSAILPQPILQANTPYQDQENARALIFLNRANMRELDRVKWPANPDTQKPSKVNYVDLDSAKTLAEKVKITNQNCTKFGAQYESEVQALYGIKKGSIGEFSNICELLAVTLKRVKSPEDRVFSVIGQFLLNKFDSALFRYLESPDYERSKINNKTFFGLVGIPFKYNLAVLQLLTLISLLLNGFLFYKISTK